MNNILKAPVVPIGGIVKAGRSVTFYMHEGWDEPMLPLEKCAANLWPDGDWPVGKWHVAGNLENPYWSRPMYAVVRAT